VRLAHDLMIPQVAAGTKLGGGHVEPRL
jgi:hypothetical protein